jgi:hypothetical protein
MRLQATLFVLMFAQSAAISGASAAVVSRTRNVQRPQGMAGTVGRNPDDACVHPRLHRRRLCSCSGAPPPRRPSTGGARCARPWLVCPRERWARSRPTRPPRSRPHRIWSRRAWGYGAWRRRSRQVHLRLLRPVVPSWACHSRFCRHHSSSGVWGADDPIRGRLAQPAAQRSRTTSQTFRPRLIAGTPRPMPLAGMEGLLHGSTNSPFLRA